ncbi:hypothetical protein FHX82_006708 [Amycolatopsis bartoniae]|uniref:Uncharacterized protein n=1 Tax=Amycolatopsis bartoniae TaxID=941986 RepID=A0A8H9INN8_9PSEU|nr:hypothetical protein [Amycolatopsis bartoniae]MBB2939622.1 hypothetical protein [Amycolatopsis bartoniae]TVT07828.1 hypothetical protein FNH07_14980 [Amycolatopsis bartoniae]GHF39679.1 hypothetical protein GCM10017566_11240 [Amycolatopsis bartoniae]
MGTDSYTVFLVVGILMAAVDGQIIYRSGRGYLDQEREDPGAASAMTVLITALFHLVVLGALALISTVHFPGGDSMPAIMGRLGVYLLTLAVAHAITLGVFARRREERVVEDLNARTALINGAAAVPDPRARESEVDAELREPTTTPVPGQEGRQPKVSPNLEQRGPYSTGQF